VAVDLGGTWVRVIATRDDDQHRRFTGASPGPQALPSLLDRLWRRWRLSRLRVQALVVASRGVWTAAERRRLARRVRALALQVEIISDVEAAYLGALGEREGIVLLAGTGSMALARNVRGRWARAGGMGPLLGDEGSAFWIGREWLKFIGTGPGFARTRRILASRHPIPRIAALAPAVLRRARAGSRPARRIVAESQEALARLLVRSARALGLPPVIRVSWAGGLLDDAPFRAGVWRAARRYGLRIEPLVPRQDALAAVADMAARVGTVRARVSDR
jgi:N-acetylglucosamine kinase-like BadF-type ATPase